MKKTDIISRQILGMLVFSSLIFLTSCNLERPLNFIGGITPEIEEVEASDKDRKVEVVVPNYEFATNYNVNNEGRAFNIERASQSIHNIVLSPGDVFSFNHVVGPAGEAEGYKQATVFVDKKRTKGFGGGVCQVSSTLYNSAMGAGMEIVERHPHSLDVEYIAKGKDAAVAYESLDLKFKNVKSYPVLIKAEAVGGELKVTIEKSY